MCAKCLEIDNKLKKILQMTNYAVIFASCKHKLKAVTRRCNVGSGSCLFIQSVISATSGLESSVLLLLAAGGSKATDWTSFPATDTELETEVVGPNDASN